MAQDIYFDFFLIRTIKYELWQYEGDNSEVSFSTRKILIRYWTYTGIFSTILDRKYFVLWENLECLRGF